MSKNSGAPCYSPSAFGRQERQGAREISMVGRFTGILFAVIALLLMTSASQAAAPSCVGASACTGNTGEVGEGACNGDFACLDNSGDIGKSGCQGFSAC